MRSPVSCDLRLVVLEHHLGKDREQHGVCLLPGARLERSRGNGRNRAPRTHSTCNRSQWSWMVRHTPVRMMLTICPFLQLPRGQLRSAYSDGYLAQGVPELGRDSSPDELPERRHNGHEQLRTSREEAAREAGQEAPVSTRNHPGGKSQETSASRSYCDAFFRACHVTSELTYSSRASL